MHYGGYRAEVAYDESVKAESRVKEIAKNATIGAGIAARMIWMSVPAQRITDTLARMRIAGRRRAGDKQKEDMTLTKRGGRRFSHIKPTNTPARS